MMQSKPAVPGPVRRSSRQTVQSAEIGAELLKALGRFGPSISLSRLSETLGMPAAKVHRYLQALIASGLAVQNPATQRYDLGPEMLSLGLTALARIDVVEAAARHLPGLRDAVGHTCFLAVWANRGATVVRVVEAVGTVTVVTRVGSVLPLLGSATGLMFAATLQPTEAEAEAHAELRELRRQTRHGRSPLAARLDAIRATGQAAIHGLLVPGIDAVAVPVYHPEGHVAAVLTSLGPARGFDASPDGPIARRLSATASAIGAGPPSIITGARA